MLITRCLLLFYKESYTKKELNYMYSILKYDFPIWVFQPWKRKGTFLINTNKNIISF